MSWWRRRPHAGSRALLPLLLLTAMGAGLIGGCATRRADQLQGTLYIAVGVSDDESLDASLQMQVRNRIDILSSAFREINPDMALQVQIYPRSLLERELRQRSRSGLGPDLVLITRTQSLELERLGLIRPMQVPASLREQMEPAILTPSSTGSGFTGLPVLLNPQLACYDRSRLPTSPDTIADLLAASAGGIRVGLPLEPINLAWSLGPFAALSAMESLLEGRPLTVTEQQHIGDWIQWLLDARQQERIGFYRTQQQLQQQLLDGHLDWISCIGSSLPRLQEQMGERLGTAPLPRGPGGEATPISRQQILALGVSSSPTQQLAAQSLATFAVSPLIQRDLVLRSQGSLPVNRRVPATVAGSSTQRALMEAEHQSLSTRTMTVLVGSSPDTLRPLGEALVAILFSDMDRSQATNLLIGSRAPTPR